MIQNADIDLVVGIAQTDIFKARDEKKTMFVFIFSKKHCPSASVFFVESFAITLTKFIS
jgi:hypothetical protein